MELEKYCKQCGKVFNPVSNTQIFCSKKCQEDDRVNRRKEKRHKDKKSNSVKTCPVCGSEFMSDSVNNKYCSRLCAYENHNKSRKTTKTKTKVIIINTTKEKDEFYTGILE